MKSIRNQTRRVIPGLSILASLMVVNLSVAQEFDVDLARQATEILNEYCKVCHGEDFNFPQLDVTSREALLAPNGKNKQPFIVPGKPDESRIWARVAAGEMPPEYMPQPSEEQNAILKKWIADGGHFPPIDPAERSVRPFFGQKTALEIIDEDLDGLDEDDIEYTRYFSLIHLWNDTSGSDPVTDEDLRMIRASVSKMINSLSTKPRVIPPRIVDKEYGTMLAIDLRHYGWTSWHWNQLLIEYPYGLKIGGRVANRVYSAVGTRIPYLRADWFVYNASRPPLYHSLLNIPKNAKTLEARLGVDIYQNFMDNTLLRAAFDGKASGVSKQNRMVERHEPTRGTRYYWKSYDILPEAAAEERGDFTRTPLGPVFDQYEGRQLAAFEHDGGEIIYSLPNGLQAYMLVDGKDRRIDKGPIDVVQDPNQHSGTPEIINGISCMGCHDQGMITWESDIVRSIFQKSEGSLIADKVLKLFPPNDEFRSIVDQDREYFMANMKKATGEFLLEGQRKRDADALTKFYGDLLDASDFNFKQDELAAFVNDQMTKPGRDTLDRKQLVMQMVASGNSEFEWGLSIDDAVGMFEINPIKNGTTFRSFADPVTKMSKMYYQDVDIEDVARELGLPELAEDAERLHMKTVAELKFLCEMRQFQNLGLANLAREGGTITRATWERAFHRVARETGSGIPVDVQ